MEADQMDRVLELVVFRLKDGVSRERLLETTDAVSEWATRQPGFVSRDLSYAEEADRWIEVVYWRTMQDAEAASVASESSSECAPMFALIDLDSMLFLHGVPGHHAGGGVVTPPSIGGRST